MSCFFLEASNSASLWSSVLKNLSAFVAAPFLSSTFNLTNLTTFWRSTLTSLAIPGSAIEFLAIIFKKTELS